MMDILHITQVLTTMQMGFWTIELPNHSAPKLYGDIIMHTALGVKMDALTPEEFYEHWMQHIDSKYLPIVIQMAEALKQGKSSEVKYWWQHPQKGWLWVRCGGYLDKTYTEGFRFKGWHYDVTNEVELDDLTNEKNEILDAFYNVYSSIVEINLCTEQAYFLKSTIKELDQKILSMEQLYHAIIERFHINKEKDAVKHFLDIDNLKSVAEKQDTYTFDFPAKEGEKTFKWKCIETLYIPKNKDKIYLTFCNVDEKHLMNSILKHFVFSDSDYLYYVDLKNNSFLNFCKNDENLLLPPQHGNDYVKTMTDYNKKYVVLDEQDKVIELMMPDYMTKRLQNEDSYKIEAGMIDDNGNYNRKQVTIQNYDRENQTLFIIRKDITKEYFRQKEQQQILTMAHKMANTDTLTNLYNRKGACTEIEQRLLNIKDEMDAFIIMDLDNFKTVNDCLGHSQGDELLQKIAKTLEENFRKTDIIARLGGDEFIIYMKDIKSKKAVVNAVEKLLSKLQLKYPWKNGSIQVSASVGIAIVPFDGMRFEDLYIKSDKALYNSKRQGKNGYSFFMANPDF